MGALGVAWVPFWVLWGSFGLHFGGSGDPWAAFWRLWGTRGCLWGSLGAPLAAQGAQSQIFPIFSLPFWGHFGSMLEVKTDPKSDTIVDCFFDGFSMDFGWILEVILEICWSCVGTFRNLAKP